MDRISRCVLPAYFVRLFEHVAEHLQFYKLMLCGEGIGGFQKLVKAYLVEQGEVKVRELTQANQQLVVPPAMYVQYVAGAVISTLAWWLEDNMPHSPGRMAQYLLLLHGTLSIILDLFIFEPGFIFRMCCATTRRQPTRSKRKKTDGLPNDHLALLKQ